MKSQYILLSALLLTVFSSCERMSSNDTNLCTCTFKASFLQTKAVNAEGIQTFKAGEQIDIWDVSTHELSHFTIAEKDIADAGKTVTFTAVVNPSSDILAVYPGGYGSDCWGKSESAPRLNALNSSRDGLATAVYKAGAERKLSFTNVLSCVSFSSSKSVSEVNCCAYLYGRNGETFPSGISIDPTSGAASAIADGLQSYAFTELAFRYPQDIRIWVLPELNLSKGFILKIGSSAEHISFTREVPVPVTVSNNSFMVLGDIDVTTVSFTLGASATNMNGRISISPSNTELMYIPCIEKKVDFDVFNDDAEAINAVLRHYQDKYGVNWKSSVKSDVCRKGSDEVIYSGLESDTDYVAFVFAVDDDINVISGITKISFHTTAVESCYSYEDFLGDWIVSGSTVDGSFNDCVWTFEEREKGVSYNVYNLLKPVYLDKDSYIALYKSNESNGITNSSWVHFPVGNDNPGSTMYRAGTSKFYVFLAGLTSDQKSVIPFSLVPVSSTELKFDVVLAKYIAGEYHDYDSKTDGPKPNFYLSAPIEITSIVRKAD